MTGKNNTDSSNLAPDNNQKKMSYKWLLSITIPLGLLVSLISTFFVYVLVEFKISSVSIEIEKKDIQRDFGQWMSNGFVAVYENGTEFIHYPDGVTSPDVSDIIKNNTSFPHVLAISKNKVLFGRTKSVNKNISTELFLTDWKLENEIVIGSSFDGDCQIDVLENGNISLVENKEYGHKYVIDIISGKTSVVDEVLYLTMYNALGKFELVDDEYKLTFPSGQSTSFKCFEIDSNISALLNKWSFQPERCRRLIDGTNYCLFKRNKKSFRTTAKACFIIQTDNYGNILSYQFSPIESDLDSSVKIIDIRESFAKSILF